MPYNLSKNNALQQAALKSLTPCHTNPAGLVPWKSVVKT